MACLRPDRSRVLKRLHLAMVASTILTSGLAVPAFAQTGNSIAPPPVRQPIDENGVDVLRATINVGHEDISIGGGGALGLSYGQSSASSTASTFWRDSVAGTLNQSGSVVTATVNGVSDSFTVSGSTYTSTEGNGATLVLSGAYYIYTSRDGSVVRFEDNANYYYGFYKSGLGRMTDITYPDGTVMTFTYKLDIYCKGGWENGSCPGTIQQISRLQSLNNSNGYQLKFSYGFNGPGTSMSYTEFKSWATLV